MHYVDRSMEPLVAVVDGEVPQSVAAGDRHRRSEERSDSSQSIAGYGQEAPAR